VKTAPFDSAFSPLRPFLQTAAIQPCPSFEPAAAGIEASAGGYGYNNHYLGSSLADPAGLAEPDNVPAKLSMIGHPAAKIAFADAALANTPAGQLIEYSFLEPPLVDGFPTSPSIHFRHRDKANIAWADGHVTLEPLAWTHPGKNAYGADNARAKLGFPASPHDNSLFHRP